MKEILSLIPEDILPIISDYVKIIIPAFLTYLATKHSLNNPRRYEIKEKQFQQVYLPLYLLTQQYILEAHGDKKENISTYIKKVEKLIHKNYPYVYPKTLRLFKDLKVESSKQNMNQYFISNFSYQVTNDYNTLKKVLGYPCDSVTTSIKQLNWLDKSLFFVNFMLLVFLLFCVADYFSLLLDGHFIKSLVPLFASAFLAFILYVLHCLKKH